MIGKAMCYAPLLFSVRVDFATPSKKRRNKDCQGLFDFRSVFDMLTIASGLLEDCLKTFQFLLRIFVALEFLWSASNNHGRSAGILAQEGR